MKSEKSDNFWAIKLRFVCLNDLTKEVKSSLLTFVSRYEIFAMGLAARLLKFSNNLNVTKNIYGVFLDEVSPHYLFGVLSFGAAIFHCLPFIKVCDSTVIKKAGDDFKESLAAFFKGEGRGCVPNGGEIFCVNGERAGTDLIKDVLVSLGETPCQTNIYNLMAMDEKSLLRVTYTVPDGMKLVNALEIGEGTRLFQSLIALHYYYESQEIVIGSRTVDKDASRVRMKSALQNERVLVLKKDLNAISKAQTNAIGFRHAQIGGVATKKSYQSRHYGRVILSAFVIDLYRAGYLPVLFVKKSNTAALLLYNRIGFTYLNDNEIVYFDKGGTFAT